MAALGKSQADGVPAAVSRNHPFNEPAHGSNPARYGPGQPRRPLFHRSAGRRCRAYFPPNESSWMSTMAVLPARMAFILPKVTGRIVLAKNSMLLSWPS